MEADPESKKGYIDEKVDDDHRNDSVYAEKAGTAEYKAAAIEAENEEHNMTVMQAVRQYPMASFWAFVMSFTIVSGFPLASLSMPPAMTDTDYLDHGIL